MVEAQVYIFGTASAGDGGSARVIFSTDGGTTSQMQGGVVNLEYQPNNSRTNTGTTTKAIDVYAGVDYLFGCRIGATTGLQDGEQATCVINWVCVSD
jgi:hypothetical protein